MWRIVVTEVFEAWYTSLSFQQARAVGAVILQLETRGPQLGFPYSSKVLDSRYSHMRELRIRAMGRPYRVLYAFDPNRAAVLLIGGDKTGDDRWYETNVPIAERVYSEYLNRLGRSP